MNGVQHTMGLPINCYTLNTENYGVNLRNGFGRQYTDSVRHSFFRPSYFFHITFEMFVSVSVCVYFREKKRQTEKIASEHIKFTC